jgi:hypothetical protein
MTIAFLMQTRGGKIEEGQKRGVQRETWCKRAPFYLAVGSEKSLVNALSGIRALSQ